MSAKKKTVVQPDKIYIADIQIIKCNIDCPFAFSTEDVQSHEYHIDFDLGFNLEDNLVKADFKLEITTISSDEVETEATGIFHFIYIFNVENLKDLAVADVKKEIILDGGLGNALASITYSTSRGILFCRLKGTGLESFILPVIDPNSLLK